MERQPIRMTTPQVRLPVRKRDTHKSDYGKLLILGGCVGYTGAVTLCARAALRSGAGLVSVGVPADIYPIIAVKLDEAMPFPIARPLQYEAIAQKLGASTVCVIGPGMGRSEDTQAFAREVLRASTVPTVVDADALFAVKDDLALLRGKIITPHAGEFARLGGNVTGDRIEDAAAFAETYGCTVVLKGHETVITDGKETYVNQTGNPGMAVGGSGDLLSGILVSLLGQGIEPLTAAGCGAWLHGKAGDLCAERMGQYGMLPTDMVEVLPRLLK